MDSERKLKWRLDAPLESTHGVTDRTFQFAVIERLDLIIELLERICNGDN